MRLPAGFADESGLSARKRAGLASKEASMAEPKRMTKAQIISDLAERTGLSKKEVTAVFDELRSLIQKELGNQGPGEVVIPELIKLKVKKVPAQPARKGKNPFTGEE